MSAPTNVLFLDGIGCNPAGFKPRFIAGLGYRVTAPNLPDLDFSASVEIADRAAHAFILHLHDPLVRLKAPHHRDEIGHLGNGAGVSSF